MSRYLSSLLERATHGSDIRPRATLPFQSAAPLDGIVENETFVDAAPTPIARRDTPPMQLPPPPERSTEPPAPPRERTIDRTIVSRETERVIVHERTIASEAERASQTMHPMPETRPAVEPRPATSHETPVRDAPLRPIAVSVVVPRAREEKIVREERGTAPAAPPQMQTTTSVAPRSDAPRSIAPMIVPAASSQHAAPFLPPTIPAEPTVRITIGRVDVRAIVQPQSHPAKTAAPPRPRVTLDDYLRTRNGGQR